MFTGISTQICQQAWGILTPAIEKAAEEGVLNGLRGSVLVIDPNSDTDEILFVGHVGEEDPQFLVNIKAKAAVTLRTGIDSARVRQDFPHLYQAGDIVWPGAIHRDGLVVAYSGVQGELDEMIAEWMVAAIRGISREQMHRPGGPTQADSPYLSQ